MMPDTTPLTTREPIYDYMELTDNISTIDLSKNVAYVKQKSNHIVFHAIIM